MAKWQSEAATKCSIFQIRRNSGNPIPRSQIIGLKCDRCEYHTAWRKSKDEINCGWCLANLAHRARLTK